jgi:hypothetical protein
MRRTVLNCTWNSYYDGSSFVLQRGLETMEALGMRSDKLQGYVTDENNPRDEGCFHRCDEVPHAGDVYGSLPNLSRK